MKHLIRRYGRALALAGGLAVGGAVAAVVSVGASPGPALATAGQTLSITGQALSTAAVASKPKAGASGPSAPAPGDWGGGGGRHGWPGGLGGFRLGRGLTVTSVSGNTITATGRGGQTVTVQVSATTAYTEAGTSAALTDVHTGSIIAVQGSYANTSETSINATAITIVLPSEAGVVTNVNGNTLTLTSFDGASRTVTVSGSTRYKKAGQSAALADVTSGTSIVVEGTLNSDGSLSAVRVTIQVPRLAGQVTAVNGTSYTVMGRFSTTDTVVTTSSTTYVNADGTTASASAVKTGVFIIAEGSLSSDGKTLTALRVTVLSGGNGHGFGRHRGFGGFGQFGFGGANGGASGTVPGAGATVPSTTGTTSV